MDDTFELYDLKVTIEEIQGRCTCEHAIGDYFELKGGKLCFPEGQSFCLYALTPTLPLLPAKQRHLHPNDWMRTDSRVVCADPLCGCVMLIQRQGLRTLKHSDTSAVEMEKEE